MGIMVFILIMPSGFTFRGGFCCFLCLVACFFLLQCCFSLTSKTPPFARFSHSSRCCARRRRGLCLIFASFKKTRRNRARYSVVLFWLRLGPKIEKRGLRGVFLTWETMFSAILRLALFAFFCLCCFPSFALLALWGGGVGAGGGGGA